MIFIRVLHWLSELKGLLEEKRYFTSLKYDIRKCSFGNISYYCSIPQLCPTLRPHSIKHARLPCPSPTPRVCSNSYPLSQWHHPTISSSISPFPPAFDLSQRQSLFKWVHIRWPKYWSFSFSISPSSEHPGLISFRMDWLDLLGVQGTLKSLLQHHSSKASILRRSAFFIVQLSHPYMTTGKTIALTSWNFVGKVAPLLFNMLSRLVISFLPRIKHLLISWLQSPPSVILEPPKIKSATVSTVSPSICHEVMGPDAMVLVFWMLHFKPTFYSRRSLSSRGRLVLFLTLSSFTTLKFLRSSVWVLVRNSYT